MARKPASEPGSAAAPSREAPSVRLFLALDLPEPARTEIAGWRDSVTGGRPELRPVAAEALHVTLIFLGRRPAGQVEDIWGIAVGAAAGLPAPTLTARGLVPVPRRRPRLLALDLGDEAERAAAVQRALSGALEAAGIYEPEKRAFWPHATLARVRARARVGTLDPPPPPATQMQVRALALYRSDLHPSGARYVPLERLELGR